MPMLPPRRCACGYKIAARELCPCEQKRKAAADKGRPTAAARGYDSKWQTERAAFLKVHKTCARCGAPATVIDHRIPHRGDRKLFWDRSNWSPLCRPCHDRWKQSTERRREKAGVVSDFRPSTEDRRAPFTSERADLEFQPNKIVD